MDQSLFSQRNRGRDILLVVGWLVVVGLGAGMVWYSFASSKPQQTEPTLAPEITVAASRPTPTQPLVFPTAAPATNTPVPTTQAAPPSPTPAPTTVAPTPGPTPYIVAGEDGVNVRNGPDISNEQLGYIDPGGQAEYVSTDDNWVQIQYNGEPAWVYGPLVTIVEEPEAAPTAPPGETTAPTGEVIAWSEEIAQLINQKRSEQGLAPYTVNEALKQAALLHAVDSADRGELTHTGSDGSTVSTRAERAGYSSTDVTEITVTGQSTQFAIDWWMNETPPDDPHRSAILSDWTTEMGVAVVDAGDTYYFVAVFGRP